MAALIRQLADIQSQAVVMNGRYGASRLVRRSANNRGVFEQLTALRKRIFLLQGRSNRIIDRLAENSGDFRDRKDIEQLQLILNAELDKARLRLSEVSKETKRPGNSKPADVPTDSKPADVPKDSQPADVPKDKPEEKPEEAPEEQQEEVPKIESSS